jgi:basic amino acid/polyamine antiporter, APA family
MMRQERVSLARVLGRWDVLTLAFGAMIGWGWVILAGDWLERGGLLGTVAAFVAGGIMCVLVGLTYAELTSAMPLAGGELNFSYRGLGLGFSWVTGWAITFAYVSVSVFEAVAISTALDYLVPLPKFGYLWTLAGWDVYLSWALVGMVLAALLTWLNYTGIKPTAITQNVLTAGLALGGLMFIVGSFFGGSTANTGTTWTGFGGFAAVAMMVPFMMVGFDVIPQAAEETRIPLRLVGRILVFAVILAATWYVLVAIGVSLALPEEARKASKLVTADAMGAIFGPGGASLLVLAGICGILSSWNAFFVGGSRVIFAMSRAKMLHPSLAAVHPKHRTPYRAILLVGILCVLAPLLGRPALVWFVDAGGLGTSLAYFMVAIAFLVLRSREPGLARPYLVKAGTVVGLLAVLSTAFFITLYMPFGAGALVWPYEWLMVFGWVALGAILYLVGRRSYGHVSAAERELLMFGPELARPEIVKGTDSPGAMQGA